MQLIANMTTKLTQKEMDANFHDWMTDLVEDPDVELDIKRIIVRDFCERRHVLIVETANFFPEMDGDQDAEEMSNVYSVLSKAFPTMVTEGFDDLDECYAFCADHGMTYEVNLTDASRLVH